MTQWISALIATAIPMLILDAFWLTTMAPRLYRPRIGHLMAETPAWGAAAAFYLLYTIGLTILLVIPSVQSSTGYAQVFAMSALFGCIAYATYDLTNQATLRDWSWVVTGIDMVWGALLTGTVVTVAVWIMRQWF